MKEKIELAWLSFLGFFGLTTLNNAADFAVLQYGEGFVAGARAGKDLHDVVSVLAQMKEESENKNKDCCAQTPPVEAKRKVGRPRKEKA